jgi:YfiH family protein
MTIWTCRGSSADMTTASDVRAVDLGQGVQAWFTGSRIDGLDDANLAHHRPHSPERLGRAREMVARITGTDASAWHLMRQIHGAAVGVVDGSTPVGAELRDVDLLVTREVDRPLVVLAADCVPILAAGDAAIAAAHAGWRGLAADVPGALVTALSELGERVGDLRVALGPAIGPCCYEVGPEVVEVIANIDVRAVSTTRRGAPSVDLRAAVVARLRTLGVTGVLDATPGCTACDSGWFSHRRDPSSGRQAGIIVRREATSE